MLEEAVWIKRGRAGYFDGLCFRSNGERKLQVQRLPGEQDNPVTFLRLKAVLAYLQLIGADR